MRTKRTLQAALVSGVLLSGGLTAATFAQTDHTNHPPEPAQADQSLAEQLTELRAKVVRLEAALEQNHRQAAMKPDMPMEMDGMGRGGMNRDGMNEMKPMSGGGMSSMGMGGMKMDGMDMDGMGAGASGGMKMDGMGMSMDSDAAGGMSMMGMMKGMDKMGGSQSATAQSALPGFPGASHLYHIGATSFFLDHDAHIELTTDQRAALNQIKQKTELAQNTAGRKIEEAEQQLWELTASDEPDVTKIETKVREIESLRGDRRLGYIRAVGEAAKVLTDEQRKALVGQASAPAPAEADPAHDH